MNMSVLQFVLLLPGAAGLALLLLRGAFLDRAAAVVMASAVAMSFVVDRIAWNGFHYGLAVVDGLTFIALWLIAERAGRWWIVFAAAFQLLATLGYGAPLLSDLHLAWEAVTLSWAVWLLLVLTFFFGVWEIEADRRFAFGGRHGSTVDDGGGSRPAPSME